MDGDNLIYVAETLVASPPPTSSPASPPEVKLPPVSTPTPSTSTSGDPIFAPVSTTITNPISALLSVALEKIQFNKRKKLDKILALAAKRRSIKNDDVEKLLRVSDSTATRYLKQLVQEGKLKITKTRNDAFYELV